MKKYETYFNRWSKWCSGFEEVVVFPARDIHVVLFIVSLIQSRESYSVIESCFYAIKHAHKIGNLDDPTSSSLTRYALEAAKRTCSRPVRKKEPITPDHIKRIHVEMTVSGKMSLLHLRDFTMILLCYSGFLRFEEVARLTLSDIVFNPLFMKIFIEESKTDQYRIGAWVFVAKMNSNFCPVEFTRNYIGRAEITDLDDYLFRGVSYFKTLKDHKLRKHNKPISYSTARSSILNYMKNIGLDESKFGTHSLRRGGATRAANNGIKDRLFQKHGRWKSVSAKDGYVDDDLENLLSVSLGLGL